MAIEVKGFDEKDLPLTGEVSLIASSFCIADGMKPGESYITAGAGADYAGRIILTALREMGVIPESGIDEELFKSTVNGVMHRSNVSENLLK